jgi:L-alanine-DL-glutamate epimerase-like enolase superfamily enzyme
LNLDVHELTVPLRRAFRIARSTTHEIEPIVLEIEHEGVSGYGEAHPMPAVTGESRSTTLDALETLDPVDIDPGDVPATLGAHAWLPPAARAALDVALHDVHGKRTKKPVTELLDLPEGEQASAATVGVGTPDEAREEARTWIDSGYLRPKIKIDDPATGLEAVRAVADLLPRDLDERFPTPEVWVDANEALTLDEAIDLAQALEELDVTLFEQPIPRGDWDALEALARQSPIPILVDEPVQTPEDVRQVGRIDAPTMANVKVQKVGGLAQARDCIEAGRETDAPIVVGCCIQTGLGIAAGCTLTRGAHRVDLDGNLFLEHDPFPLPRPKPGYAGTLAGPGLGVHPDPRYRPT